MNAQSAKTEFQITNGGDGPKTGPCVFDLLGAAPYVISGDGDLRWIDVQTASRLLCAPVEALPQSAAELFARLEDGGKARQAALAGLTWDGAKFQIEYRMRTFDGRMIWAEERARRGEDGEIIGVITNIQTRKLAEEGAGYRAAYDTLTGLWNEARLTEGLTHMLAYGQRYEQPCALIVLAVGNLADINASYGYEAGDSLLAAIAKRLQSGIRAPDFCARLSGARLAAGLTHTNADQIQAAAARLIKTLSDTPYPSPYGDLYAEFSSGGAAFAAEPISAAKAQARALTALAHNENLAISSAAHGSFTAYSPDLTEIKPRRMSDDLTKDAIIHALNDRRITLAYQPIVHAQSRSPHHFECLLRLRRDDGELISAADFIMAAERIDCVHLLDRRALEIAAEALRDYPEIKLALNVSAATVKNPETANAYLQALRATGHAAQRVTIELTETVALEDPAMASRFSVEARALGCKFAIDDFGAGYTTFRNLMAIEADEIKIDGSFIRDLSLTPHKQTFVRMMVDLAQTFSVKTVAEMVGSREDADLLTRLGVDFLQGYMFGMPGPAPILGAAPMRTSA